MAADLTDEMDFTLPSLGSDMDEGTVLTWLVDVGDRVVKGDVLLRVDTEKAEIDVEVWHEAVVLELLVGPGDTVPVGTTIARLGAAPVSGATTPPTDREPTQTPSQPALAEVTTPAEPAPAPTSAASGAAASPPSLPGRVASSDRTHGDEVQATPRLVYWPNETGETPAPETPGPETSAPDIPAPDTPKPAQSRAERRQGAVAALMERSNREIPHFHLVRQIDLTATMAWLDEHNNNVPPTERILPAAVLLYAVAKAAQGSTVNGTFQDKPFEADRVDLGVAVHVRGGGLMTPVLPAAEDLSLDTLMQELQGMVGRARSNRLSTRDMSPATLTVTNLGDSGVDRVLGVIRPPERALVGFGRIAERPIVIDGVIEVARTVDVSLSADHRVVNGQAGARFLDALNKTLSQPDAITLAGEPHDH